MQCNEIITRDVETITTEQPVYEAAALMLARDIGFVPVCDDAGQVVGTLTDRDITTRLVAAQRSSDTPVRDIMTPEVVSCRPTDPLHEAEDAMRKHHVSRLVCLDHNNRLMGVVSLADVARHDDAQHLRHTMQSIKSDEQGASAS